MAKKVMVIPATPTSIHSEGGTGLIKTRVAGYCRVSSDNDQEGSFQNQVEYFTNLINNNPGWEMVDIFADDGISGTGTKRRGGFNDMIKACEDGKVDLVITKSISR